MTGNKRVRWDYAGGGGTVHRDDPDEVLVGTTGLYAALSHTVGSLAALLAELKRRGDRIAELERERQTWVVFFTDIATRLDDHDTP